MAELLGGSEPLLIDLAVVSWLRRDGVASSLLSEGFVVPDAYYLSGV
jgi:hypothetical protein